MHQHGREMAIGHIYKDFILIFTLDQCKLSETEQEVGDLNVSGKY